MFNYYLRLALSSIRRTPVLSALMVLALGLGIGAFMTTFTVYHLMSGDPIPHRSDMLYAVQLDNWDPNRPPTESARDVRAQLTWQDGNNLVLADTPATRQVHMYGTGAVVVPEGNDPPFDESVRATWHSFFPMFDVPFLYGGPWGQAEDEARAGVAVIGRELNDKLFNGENSVGRDLQLDDQHYRVVGVIDDWQPMPRFYHSDWGRAFEDTEQVFIPMNRAIDLQMGQRGNTNCWKMPDEDLPLFEGFLKSECVFTQFWAELETPQQVAAYKDYLDNYVRGQKAIGRFERPLATFISDVMEWMDVMRVVRDDNRVLLRLSFLFLLVCVLNTVGLLMAKFMGKGGEVALRRAMGASRRQVFQQNLIEVGLIGVLGGLAGAGLAWLGLRAVENMYRGYQHLVHLDAVMLLTAIATATVFAVLAGMYPVWRVSRLAPAGLLKTQ
ncbi:MAG: ABC transporter permease [Xanthomonadales bacterium]|nr:ABC transporter permease [Gammaproteobacteria bacterium]MBT8050824.1 ABC transporter permease [Gammaproteobacteria bacterium]MBT8055581.1 ABC transporter permease [Gammaproteobacteria bacterium]NNJ78425.1 ABC transporter permease [Xanthomonadales bacterium]NNL03826.1 ABC transporter permease [Xanthomonadales bacterium]